MDSSAVKLYPNAPVNSRVTFAERIALAQAVSIGRGSGDLPPAAAGDFRIMVDANFADRSRALRIVAFGRRGPAWIDVGLRRAFSARPDRDVCGDTETFVQAGSN